MAGYEPDVIRDFVERFGSEDPIAKAEEEARTVPGFGEEIHRVETEIGWLSGAFMQHRRVSERSSRPSVGAWSWKRSRKRQSSPPPPFIRAALVSRNGRA
jgi:hypothetical protein